MEMGRTEITQTEMVRMIFDREEEEENFSANAHLESSEGPCNPDYRTRQGRELVVLGFGDVKWQ